MNRNVCVVLILFGGCLQDCIANTIVSPAGYENVAGAVDNAIPFEWKSPRYQQVYGAADLTGVIGQQITGIAFRVDEDPRFGFNYAGGFAYSSVQIELSITPLAVEDLTSNLNANRGPSPVTVPTWSQRWSAISR